MSPADEDLRNAITDAFSRQGIDARNLAVEVAEGAVSISGSVPNDEQRGRVPRTVAAVVPDGKTVQIAVAVIPVPPTDSADARGRSPMTGTSADSEHESRHQRDR